MQVVYTGEDPAFFSPVYTKSMFLAGPSPRKDTDPNWREEALKVLEALGYDGVVYLPIWRDGPPDSSGKPFDYDGQVEWETKYLNACDLIVFWVPRNMQTLPSLTTNVEFGLWLQSGKVLLGSPPIAEHMRYLNWQAGQEGVPAHDNMADLLADAVTRLGKGAPRSGGERDVPLHLWVKPEFQTWLKAQYGVGNRLTGAKVVWTFRVGKNKERVFLWALHVDVYIAAEDRHKTNEIIIFRPDISTIVAYCRPNMYESPLRGGLGSIPAILNTEIVLVSEFRSPANNVKAMVSEVPGGSSPKAGVDPLVTASEEMHEETGLELTPDRFQFVGARQVAATLAAHKAHVYAVELDPREMRALKAEAGKAHGNHEDTEYTFVEVTTVGGLLSRSDVDWSNVGMILSVILTRG